MLGAVVDVMRGLLPTQRTFKGRHCRLPWAFLMVVADSLLTKILLLTLILFPAQILRMSVKAIGTSGLWF
jgi:hypothetical protein